MIENEKAMDFSFAKPRPDLNGYLVKLPGNLPAHSATYLIDKGRKRPILTQEIFNALFATGAQIVTDININEIPTGKAISIDSILIRSHEASATYWLDSGRKRIISTPEIFNKYHFNWGNVEFVSQIALNAIRNGSDLT